MARDNNYYTFKEHYAVYMLTEKATPATTPLYYVLNTESKLINVDWKIILRWQDASIAHAQSVPADTIIDT